MKILKVYKPIFLLMLLFLATSILLLGTGNATNQEEEKDASTKGTTIQLTGLYSFKNDTNNGSFGRDPFVQNAFIPGISFIMDFSYLQQNLDSDTISALETPGYFEGHDHEEGHNHGTSGKGFNLNYGELVLFASVDPYFDLFTAFHLSEGDFEIEEAYVSSRRLPLGLGLKIGKFLSSFGRINSQHAHTWDFKEIPLVFQAFFGAEGLSEKGIQLNWIAPTDFFFSLGVETLQGTNETSFGTEGFHLEHTPTAEMVEIAETPLPNLLVFFGNTSFETGNLVILGGVSYATGHKRENHLEEEHEPHAFSGTTGIFGLDGYLKYIIDSRCYLAIQGEYLARHINGTRYTGSSGEPGETTVSMESLVKNQTGGYVQWVYRFHPIWGIGGRWEFLSRLNLSHSLSRLGVMLDYNPTEFSRIRFQYNRNQYQYLAGTPKNYNTFTLQFNFAIGAHGAHAF